MTTPGDATATGKGDEPPSGRPTKALLAAAAIAGALLISLPFLAFGADDDGKQTKAVAEPTSGMTIPKSEALKAPGAYTAQSPSPSVSKDKKTKEPTKEPKTGPTTPSADPTSEKKQQAKKKHVVSKGYALAPSQYKNFMFKNAMTGLCADLPGYDKGKLDGPVNQFHCRPGDSDNQMWDFELAQKAKGPDGSNLVLIKNKKSGLCFDLPDRGGKAGGTGINQTYCNGSFEDNQLWWVEDRGNRKFWIHNYASGQQCLDVWGKSFGSGGADARLGIADCNPADDHAWYLKVK
ncbi:RICIN domain-containing protein [Streptomyces sp. M19]